MIYYFLAGVSETTASLSHVEKLGLGYAFDLKSKNTAFAKRGVMRDGPDGGAGVIVGQSDIGMGYYPKDQTWEKHKTIDGVWVGVSAKGDPKDYIRSDWKGKDGRPLVTESWPLVADDRIWPIPVARAYGETLPHEVEWDGEKFVKGQIIPQFKRLSEIGLLLVEEYQDSKLPDNFHQLAFEVVSAAYLIGPQEFAMLKIIGWEAEEAFKLLRLVLDLPGLIERQQKKTDSEPVA